MIRLMIFMFHMFLFLLLYIYICFFVYREIDILLSQQKYTEVLLVR